MPKTRQQKEETVQKLTEKFGRAKAIVLADYKGLKMTQLSELRDKLRDQGAEASVNKNSLINLALKENKLAITDQAVLEGPTLTLLAFEDEVSPIKSLVTALKDAQTGKVKAGFLGENYLDGFSVTRLASLPSKQELQAKVVGSLAAPLYGVVTVLQGNIRNLVYAVDQIRIKKGGE